MNTGVFCVLQALLLHGSLPEDEQEVSLCLGDGVENADQQLVCILSLVFTLKWPLFFHIL